MCPQGLRGSNPLPGTTLLLLAVLALGAGEGAKARLRRYEGLLKAGAEVAERIDAIRELRAADDPGIVQSLIKRAFPDPDFRVPEAAVRFLVRTATPEGLEAVRLQGPPHADARVRYYSLRTLAAVPDALSFGLLGAFAGDRCDAIRLEAAVLLGGRSEPETAEVLRGQVQDPSPIVRCAALLSLGSLEGARPDQARSGLSDPDWRVRSAALEVLVKLGDHAAAPLVRKALEKETESRLIGDFEKALEALGEARAEAALEKERARVAAEGVEGAEEAITHRGVTGIEYGPKLKKLKTVTGRIVFVLDCSASMAEPLRDPGEEEAGKPEGKRGTEYEVGGVGEKDKPKPEEALGYDRAKAHPKDLFAPTKLGFAQKELCKAIRQLKPGTSFNVVCFQSAGRQTQFRKSLVQAGEATIRDAVNFVKAQAPAGETATYDALVGAIGLGEGDLLKGSALDPSQWPDTVMLLSDGDPTEGAIIQIEEFLASLTRLHRICRTRVHTVGLGHQNLPLLDRIAEITGGGSVFVGDPQ